MPSHAQFHLDGILAVPKVPAHGLCPALGNHLLQKPDR